MDKITVTITGMDKKTISYIAKKIRPVPGGLRMELREMAPMTRKELIILTPFHDDRTPIPALMPCWYKALVPSPDPGEISREYRFRSPFSLRKELEGIEEKFGLDLRDRAIIFCVKCKNTENNWRGGIQYMWR